MPAPKIIHVLWSAQSGPLVAYRNASLAFAHAQTIVGVEVSACELREQLPEVVRDDLAVDAEFENEDTPEVVAFDVSDIDDPIE